MTSVGFGNVASETDNEKIFSIFMMVISGMLLKKSKPVCFFKTKSVVLVLTRLLDLRNNNEWKGINIMLYHNLRYVHVHMPYARVGLDNDNLIKCKNTQSVLAMQ